MTNTPLIVCTPGESTAFYKTSRAAHFRASFFLFNIFAPRNARARVHFEMPPDDGDDAALLAALNQPHVDLSELVVTDVKVHDEEALIRRVNLLEILTEEHEDVHPPPEEVVSSW